MRLREASQDRAAKAPAGGRRRHGQRHAVPAFLGHVALIEGMIARIKAERNEAMTVVATGGVASLFHGATRAIDHFEPDLTIRGLLEIYRRNAEQCNQVRGLTGDHRP